MNENHMDRYGIADIKKILARYGPWPLDRSSWDEKTWNFKNRLNNIVVNLPVKAFFSLTVLLDPKKESSYTLSVCTMMLMVYFYVRYSTILYAFFRSIELYRYFCLFFFRLYSKGCIFRENTTFRRKSKKNTYLFIFRISLFY